MSVKLGISPKGIAMIKGLRTKCCGKYEGFIQKFPDWPPGARTANGTALRQ
jgi:hypothetical protein